MRNNRMLSVCSPPMLDVLVEHDIQAYVSVVGTSQSSVRIQGYFKIQWASPVVLSGKEYACSTGTTGDVGSIPGSGRSPGRGHGNPLQYSCLDNPHGQRSLVSYSPWSLKESDMTERLSTAHTWEYYTEARMCKA